jgi:hypothetical protein
MTGKRARELLQDERGAAAVELAVVGPAFLMLLFGIIQCGLLVFTQASLHYAVQKGVRCLALHGAGSCPSPETYYYGLGAAPTFTQSAPGCGEALTATVPYSLNILLYDKNIVLSATSCFPDIKSTS